jgi:hypothetical protein
MSWVKNTGDLSDGALFQASQHCRCNVFENRAIWVDLERKTTACHPNFASRVGRALWPAHFGHPILHQRMLINGA